MIYLYCGPLFNRYKVKRQKKDSKTIKIKKRQYQIPEFDIK